MTSRRRWAFGVAALVVGCGLGLTLTELALRVAGVSAIQHYRWDRDTGTALRAGATGRWTREGDQWIRVNSAGLRDDEHVVPKPPGVYRIAVLGDSYAEALQVALPDTYWNVMERELGSRCAALSGRKVEAVNLGVSGYGTAQELLSLRHRGWQYGPDAVLLSVLPGNDVRNNARELEGDPYRPYFLLRDGELVLDRGYLEEPAFRRRMTLPFRVYGAAVSRFRVLQLVAEFRARRSNAPGVAPAEGIEAGLDYDVYRESADPVREAAWKVTEALIAEIQRDAEQRGALLFVASLTTGTGVHPDAAIRQRLQEFLNVDDLSYPTRRLDEFAAARGVRHLDLEPPMRARAQETAQFFHGFGDALGRGHWNERGHRLAGRLLAEWICDEIS